MTAEALADLSDALPLLARVVLLILAPVGVGALVYWVFRRWHREQP